MTKFKAFVYGIVVGAVAGVLYAPATGTETRRKLSETTDDLKEKFNDLKDTINEKMGNIKDDMNDMAYQEIERIEMEASVTPHTWQP